MADYYINFDTHTEIEVDDKIRDTINDMNEEDRLIITVNNTEFDKMDAVTGTLKANGFDYYPKGSHSGNRYRIIAQKMGQ